MGRLMGPLMFSALSVDQLIDPYLASKREDAGRAGLGLRPGWFDEAVASAKASSAKVVQRQQSVPSECDNHRLLCFGQSCGMGGLRPGLQILDRRSLAPLGYRLRVDPQLSTQRRERSLRSLYCCSDGVRGRGAPVT